MAITAKPREARVFNGRKYAVDVQTRAAYCRYVNLGLGIPTLAANHLQPGVSIVMQVTH